ncbi:MAG TPA: hypothetical protein QGH10_25530, partial [Armatimonadota bacterium]|nr:hypothetical protein [Armatimonadota bacterium]
MRTKATEDRPERFSQRNVGFNRQHSDEKHPARNKKTRSPNDETGRPRPYHAPEDFALQAGAWAVARRAQGMGEIWEPKEGVEPDCSEPEHLTARVKEAARLYGATMVGVARVDPRWIYESTGDAEPIELPEGVDTTVVIGVPMDYELMRSAPSAVAAASTG